MGDQVKAIDGPDTIIIYLYISSDSWHYKHFKRDREQIQLQIRVNGAQNVMIWRG